jgi:hypothetical protein
MNRREKNKEDNNTRIKNKNTTIECRYTPIPTHPGGATMSPCHIREAEVKENAK